MAGCCRFDGQTADEDHGADGSNPAVFHDRQGAFHRARSIEAVGCIGQTIEVQGACEHCQNHHIQYADHRPRPEVTGQLVEKPNTEPQKKANHGEIGQHPGWFESRRFTHGQDR